MGGGNYPVAYLLRAAVAVGPLLLASQAFEAIAAVPKPTSLAAIAFASTIDFSRQRVFSRDLPVN